MWDTVQVSAMHLSHDMPCPRCGHALHVFVDCGNPCGCAASPMPGALIEHSVREHVPHPDTQLQYPTRS
jgi:hypothetical protein